MIVRILQNNNGYMLIVNGNMISWEGISAILRFRLNFCAHRLCRVNYEFGYSVIVFLKVNHFP